MSRGEGLNPSQFLNMSMKAANPNKGIYHANDSAGGTITNDKVAIIFSI